MYRAIRQGTYKFGLLIAALILAGTATAQTPTATPTPYPDIKLVRDAGVYPFFFRTGPDTDLVEFCCVRADHEPNEELGCDAATEADTKYSATVTVQQTTFDDAEIRCYLVDDSGNASALSDNKGDIDFTPPSKGRVEK